MPVPKSVLSYPSEAEAFIDADSFRQTPEKIPYREIANVCIYDADVLTGRSLLDSVGQSSQSFPDSSNWPFSFGGHVHQGYRHKYVSIEPIIEYMFEYPYGKDAVVWLRSDAAFYRITSISEEYRVLWKPVREGADIVGHAVNTLLNIAVTRDIRVVLERICKLSKQPLHSVIRLISKHRQLVQKELHSQESRRIPKFRFIKALSTEKSWTLAIEKACQDVLLASHGLESETESPIKSKLDTSSPIPIAKRPRGFNGAIPLSIEEIEPSSATQPLAPLLKGAMEMAHRRASRSILPIHVESIELPQLYDLETKCPFCGITVARTGNTSVVERMVWHLDSMHPVQVRKDLAKKNNSLRGAMKANCPVLRDALVWPDRQIIEQIRKRDEICNLQWKVSGIVDITIHPTNTCTLSDENHSLAIENESPITTSRAKKSDPLITLNDATESESVSSTTCARKNVPLIITDCATDSETLIATNRASRDEPLIIVDCATEDESLRATSRVRKNEPVIVIDRARRNEPLITMDRARKDESLIITDSVREDKPLTITSRARKDEPLVITDDAAENESPIAMDDAAENESPIAMDHAAEDEFQITTGCASAVDNKLLITIDDAQTAENRNSIPRSKLLTIEAQAIGIKGKVQLSDQEAAALIVSAMERMVGKSITDTLQEHSATHSQPSAKRSFADTHELYNRTRRKSLQSAADLENHVYYDASCPPKRVSGQVVARKPVPVISYNYENQSQESLKRPSLQAQTDVNTITVQHQCLQNPLLSNTQQAWDRSLTTDSALKPLETASQGANSERREKTATRPYSFSQGGSPAKPSCKETDVQSR
ncbi:hypothetical protein PSACC_02856 [Paramicrosporidium saccamoebae]|uniref:Uncharacterized protein n=1 Tax=Paramicrosporidium saccamoebae TaxID=1246581 RepID=A0A2H9TI39_9FUNG|nr:hypothetical protein PSACC_02856 [Paramicrosporidium saccamoebae]